MRRCIIITYCKNKGYALVLPNPDKPELKFCHFAQKNVVKCLNYLLKTVYPMPWSYDLYCREMYKRKGIINVYEAKNNKTTYNSSTRKFIAIIRTFEGLVESEIPI